MRKIRDFKNDKEMIEFAAYGCYYPPNDQQEFAMLLVIERLVLPEGVDSYSLEEMAEFIRLALIDVSRRNERVVGVVEEHKTDITGDAPDRWSKMQAEIDRLKSMTYCAYCGLEFPLDDDAANQVSEHIRTCDKHPMREVEALADNRWKLLKEASLWIYADDMARIVHKKRFNEFLVDLAEEMAEYVK